MKYVNCDLLLIDNIAIASDKYTNLIVELKMRS